MICIRNFHDAFSIARAFTVTDDRRLADASSTKNPLQRAVRAKIHPPIRQQRRDRRSQSPIQPSRAFVSHDSPQRAVRAQVLCRPRGRRAHLQPRLQDVQRAHHSRRHRPRDRAGEPIREGFIAQQRERARGRASREVSIKVCRVLRVRKGVDVGRRRGRARVRGVATRHESRAATRSAFEIARRRCAPIAAPRSGE